MKEVLKNDVFTVLGLSGGEYYELLPIPISIQKKNRIVVYENKAMRELVGSFLGEYCFHRWAYLEDYKNEICYDCPANITLRNHTLHTIVRKSKDKTGNTVFFEITHVPLRSGDKNKASDYFLEIILDITKAYQYRNQNVDIKALRDNLWLGITTFGNAGGEIITFEPLPFIGDNNVKAFLLEMSIYVFTAIGQGDAYNLGLYGVLPVLNYTDYTVFPYTFQIKNQGLEDQRFQKIDYGILMIFMKIEFDRVMFYRKELNDFLNEYFKIINTRSDITDDFLFTLKKNLLEKIEELVMSDEDDELK